MNYDYKLALYKDIMNYIIDNDINLSEYDSRSQFEEFLSDELWIEDSVTGNGGNYYTNKYTCEEYLCHNWDLVYEVYVALDLDLTRTLHDYNNEFAQYIDCCIRCYLLTEVIEKVVADLEKSGLKYKED